MKKLSFPNILTIIRIIIVPIFMFLLLYEPTIISRIASLVLFLLATVTDFLDGYYARKLNCITSFGKFMDPLADKLLISSALISFVTLKIIPAWMVVIILGREFIITGLRIFSATEGIIVPALFLGKLKATTQMIAVIFILLILISEDIIYHFYPANKYIINGFEGVIYWSMFIVTVLTFISGVDYLIKNRRILNENN